MVHPLVSAAASGDVGEVARQLQKGTDVNTVEPDGKTALHHAAVYMRKEVVMLLLKAGASRSKEDSKKRNAEQYAAAYKQTAMAKFIAEWTPSSGSSTAQKRPAVQQQPEITIAAHANDIAKVEGCIKNGHDVNATGPDKKTALHMAAGHRYLEIVRLLLNANCSTTLKDLKGRNAETFARQYGSPAADIIAEHASKTAPSSSQATVAQRAEQQKETTRKEEEQRKNEERKREEQLKQKQEAEKKDRERKKAEEQKRQEEVARQEEESKKTADSKKREDEARLKTEAEAKKKRLLDRKRKREEEEKEEQSAEVPVVMGTENRPPLLRRISVLADEVLRCRRAMTTSNDSSLTRSLLRACEVLLVDAKVAEMKLDSEENKLVALGVQRCCEAVIEACTAGADAEDIPAVKKWVRNIVAPHCSEAAALAKQVIDVLQGTVSKRRKTEESSLEGTCLSVMKTQLLDMKVTSAAIGDDGEVSKWSLHLHGPAEETGSSPLVLGRTKHVALQHLTSSFSAMMHKMQDGTPATLESMRSCSKVIVNSMTLTACPYCRHFGAIDPLTRVLVQPSVYIQGGNCLAHKHCVARA